MSEMLVGALPLRGKNVIFIPLLPLSLSLLLEDDDEDDDAIFFFLMVPCLNRLMRTLDTTLWAWFKG